MTTTTTALGPSPRAGAGPQSMVAGRRSDGENPLVKIFVALPMLALLTAMPFAWGWGLSWTDIGLAMFFYFFTGLGVTVGFHRYFTHRAFNATRGLRIGLAIAGSMALQGGVVTWVADHRRHRSTNFWPLAIVSMGESWHNLHHADPTCARHGVGRGQLDISARLIAIFEKFGWAHEVRWPTSRRLARLIAYG